MTTVTLKKPSFLVFSRDRSGVEFGTRSDKAQTHGLGQDLGLDLASTARVFSRRSFLGETRAVKVKLGA